MGWISAHKGEVKFCRIKIHCILNSVNYIIWNGKFRFSLIQIWNLYKHWTTILHFLIRSELVTFYRVLEVSQILQSTARFLTKSRTLKLSLRVITFIQMLCSKGHILLNVLVRNNTNINQRNNTNNLTLFIYSSEHTHIHFHEMLFYIGFTLHCDV